MQSSRFARERFEMGTFDMKRALSVFGDDVEMKGKSFAPKFLQMQNTALCSGGAACKR